MDDRQLDYASPDVPPPQSARPLPPWLSPENVRFRRRVRLGLFLAFVIGMIPYPTQVCPSLKLQAVDELGRPATDLMSARWSGYVNAGSLEGNISFDMSGKASLPRQWSWASPIGRSLSIMGGFLPHSGFPGEPRASLSFNVPSGYSFDATAMGLQRDPAWSFGTMQAWWDPQTGDRFTLQQEHAEGNDVVYINIESPGRWGSKDYNVKIVLRRKVAASQPATAPASSSAN